MEIASFCTDRFYFSQDSLIYTSMIKVVFALAIAFSTSQSAAVGFGQHTRIILIKSFMVMKDFVIVH
jgi:hypothetical protein